MPVIAKELSALAVSKLKYSKSDDAKPSKISVGGVSGLMMQITPNNARSWILRTVVGERRREIGLGPYPEVSLKDARERASAEKLKIRDGIDPVEARKAAKSALLMVQKRGLTFTSAMDTYLQTSNIISLRNEKHRKQWQSTLDTYVRPIIGNKLVSEIDVSDILQVLEPIWTTKTETASRLRGRVESILAWATVKGYRSGDNPARWGGNLKEALPAPNKIANGGHQPAVQLKQMSEWYSVLMNKEGISARALEFVTLTAARSGEVRGASWDEIDFEERMWIIPKERMKAGREHRIPLNKQAIAILKAIPRMKGTNIIFHSPKGKILSDMSLSAVMRRMQDTAVSEGGKGWLDGKSSKPAVPHGLRSTFRDWAAELTNYPRDLVEMAMAHTISSDVESAYRRGDMLNKRRQLMEDWAAFVGGQKK